MEKLHSDEISAGKEKLNFYVEIGTKKYLSNFTLEWHIKIGS